jgi:NAD+ kinase
MNAPLHHVGIVTGGRSSDQADELAVKIREWLTARGIIVRAVDNDHDRETLDLGPGPLDLLLVLGGDGTMLGVARKIRGQPIPLLGINFGTLGFLTEGCPSAWRELLENVFSGRYSISERVLLEFRVFREDWVVHQGSVVNELVINRGTMAKLIRINLWYGSDHLGAIRADGLIVSTPTGSTGYSVSAGGPIVYPELDVFVVTPICPFLHAFRPMVLPFKEPLRFIPEEEGPYYLTQDGQAGFYMQDGDVVEVRRARARLLLIRPEQAAFAAKLKAKGFIRGA